jgi:hypothetical protein
VTLAITTSGMGWWARLLNQSIATVKASIDVSPYFLAQRCH